MISDKGKMVSTFGNRLEREREREREREKEEETREKPDRVDAFSVVAFLLVS